MTGTVTVAVDANGADLGAAEVAAGAAAAAERGTRVLLFGSAEEIGSVPDGVEVVDASIVRAVKAVAAGDADALVSGGSTGAAIAAGVFNIKRAGGIHRPALALPMPIPGAPILLLDVGANVEVRPEHLVQFAFMGAAFGRAVLGLD